MKRRMALHEGKQGKNGVFLAKHNDRRYPYRADSHIMDDREKDNIYWTADGKQSPFEAYEHAFYKEHFSKHLEKQNQKHISRGQRGRVRGMFNDDNGKTGYYNSEKTCPDEIIFSVGDNTNSIDPALLNEIWREQMDWEMEKFPQIKYMDYAVHCDEQFYDEIDEQWKPSAIQVHARKVYIAKDDDGDYYVNTTRCMEQMGIERPQPSAKRTRKNNEKVTYTKMCREHLQQLCIDHGIDLETEKRDPAETGRNKDEYVELKKLQRKAKLAQRAMDSYKTEKKQNPEFNAFTKLRSAENKNSAYEMKLKALNVDPHDAIKEYNDFKNSMRDLRNVRSNPLDKSKSNKRDR